MKKTLLIAAATLAVGVFSSQAQVYSQNIVGYYNVVTPTNAYSLIANQLVNGTDASQTNNNINAVVSQGCVSDPNAVENTTLYYWTGGGYNTFQYFSAADAVTAGIGSQAGWYDGSGTYQTSVSLNNGMGSFIYNPSNTKITNTFVGVVPSGTNVITISPSYNLVSITAPVATNIDSSLAGFVPISDPNAITNDVYYSWTGSGYNTYQYFSAADAATAGIGSQAGWYDGSGTYTLVVPAVGSSFFLQRIANVTTYWTNAYSF